VSNAGYCSPYLVQAENGPRASESLNPPVALDNHGKGGLKPLRGVVIGFFQRKSRGVTWRVSVRPTSCVFHGKPVIMSKTSPQVSPSASFARNAPASGRRAASPLLMERLGVKIAGQAVEETAGSGATLGPRQSKVPATLALRKTVVNSVGEWTAKRGESRGTTWKRCLYVSLLFSR
jgi:hypothetical protein